MTGMEARGVMLAVKLETRKHLMGRLGVSRGGTTVLF